MDYSHPHREIEPLAQEIAVVAEALAALAQAGILPHTRYDEERMLAHRAAVREQFEIPWTAITPRMQRLLYAINAIVQPRHMIAAGIFCGNTFISNAGAGVGPGACYTADAVEVVAAYPHPIDLLYLDADGDRGRGKGIYLEITEAALPRLHPGSVILAHNSINCAPALADYLACVRNPANFPASVNIGIDGEGLEVTVR